MNNRLFLTALLLLSCVAAFSQGIVRGTIFDKQADEPLSFVTVQLTRQGQTSLAAGVMTDADGKFRIENLAYGRYTLRVSYIGYKEITRDFELSSSHREQHFSKIFLAQDAQTLKEVQVTGQRSTMRLEVDRKVFDVGQLISNAGQAATDVLDNIPAIEVDNDGNVSLRGNSSVEVWLNGKPSGLTADNRAQILQQLPAESIERIEVIDNPSARYSAEGSAGIINIVLKKDRKAGYYGSLQAGGDTHGSWNASANINYNSRLVDAYANAGYRLHREEGHTESEQHNFNNPWSSQWPGQQSWQMYNSDTKSKGSHLFTRAGLTFHVTQKDDIAISGMAMNGCHKSDNNTPYLYGHFPQDVYLNHSDISFDPVSDLDSTLTRNTFNDGDMLMLHGEIDYTHEFAPNHKLDINFSADKWKMDETNRYTDVTTHTDPTLWNRHTFQSRPQNINNHSYELKIDYDNQFNEMFKLEAGYNLRLSREHTPQESYAYSELFLEGAYTASKPFDPAPEYAYFNDFRYDMDTHALYASLSGKFGKFSLMAGLRGEYWKVNTESESYPTGDAMVKQVDTFKKDYFQLFPSLFASYQITENDQLQLNYTRRLRRPWGGQLNSFRDTRDATMISFGNPLLTPEFSNSFSFNYLKTWTEHSLLVSAYYRPTTDVMQRINFRGTTPDGRDVMYSTSRNVAKSQSEGVEVTMKNHLFRILDLTTNVNAYYYHLDGFTYNIDGQTIRGEENNRFTWNARMQASLILPYDISIQLSGRYRSKQVITQGSRPASYSMDFGIRKNFFNKLFTLSINCRDLLNSRRWESTTEGETFWRHQVNRHNSRAFSATLTWNFGNTRPKKQHFEGDGHDHGSSHDLQNYNSAGMEE